MIRHRHTLLEFLSVEAADLRKRKREYDVNSSVFMPWFGRLQVGALGDATSLTYWAGARKERNRALGQTMSPLLKPL